MPRQPKEQHPFSIRMNLAVYERLEQFSQETGQPKTLAVERALNMYIDNYEKTQALISKNITQDSPNICH